MPKLREVVRHIRSKVAGPFWVTLDIYFPDREHYMRWHASPTLQPDSIARVYDVEPQLVAIYPVESLDMVKISYPRAQPQGGIVERDLHSGQQYVYMLDLEMT